VCSFPSTPTSTVPTSDFKLIPTTDDNVALTRGCDVDLGVSPLVCYLFYRIVFRISAAERLVGSLG
jgi:hypothetical protein